MDIRRTLAAGLAALLGLSACGQATSKVVEMDASWAVMYHSIGELKAHADLAVVGTFTKVVSQTQDDKGVPYTDFALTVQTVVHNPGKRAVEPGTTLVVHQTGGTVDKVLHQISDDPLFKVGETVAVFLTEYAPGRYRVIGGPSGRFEVSGDKVSPVNDEGVAFTGTTDTLVATVKQS